MSLIELRRVAKAYRGGGPFGRSPPVQVLEDADLRIEPGECVALVGASGSGKSTLGRILLGLERPDRGEVRFEGAPLHDRRGRIRPELRRSVQAVFQDPFGATNPRFSAFEVVAEPLRHAGQRDGLRERVAGLAQSVGLDPLEMDRPAHRFSGGQLQRLCIARALALSPRLVLLDEAVSSQDLLTQAQILRLLHRLRQETGVAYLFVTHDLRLVRGFADRLYVMAERRPVEADPRAAEVPPALARLQAAVLPAWPAGGLSPPSG
ncbi:ABC transporter ATP-binding protein [Geminicoccus harenae]|uniref:ABC transporter ATP-binding protein n=2 Tax=Geminicoccus harenae TaxID=2498453 RepID=UPI001C982D87|nr:dipeptide/oligopeptide/nickel ABC transporter ATP-binding protein [Geminicoccus harenae]